MHVRPQVISSRKLPVPGKGTDSTRLKGSLILESGRQGWMEPCWLLTQVPDSARDACGKLGEALDSWDLQRVQQLFDWYSLEAR